MKHLNPHIFETNIANFEENCLTVFRNQFHQNAIYQTYCHHIGIKHVDSATSFLQIPFLPITFFKTKKVRSFKGDPTLLFYSSATGSGGSSEHALATPDFYETSFRLGFERYFGPLRHTCILGLLPSYLEREGSSLIYMVQHLMRLSGHPLNGFSLFEHQALKERLLFLEAKMEPYFLFGVSFALLDFAQKNAIPLRYGKIIETGGMKGRKKEITRLELMDELSQAFGSNQIFSEYGMTELLSQAYASINGLYQCPPWMQVRVSELNDPFHFLPPGKSGILNIIDLANVESCAFIQSSDLAKQLPNGQFEILGRADHSDIRGCALLLN